MQAKNYPQYLTRTIPTLLLAIMLAATLAACGGESGNSGASNNGGATQTTNSASPTNGSTSSSDSSGSASTGSPVGDAFSKLENAKSYHFVYTSTDLKATPNATLKAEGDYAKANEAFHYILSGSSNKDGEWIIIGDNFYGKTDGDWKAYTNDSYAGLADLSTIPNMNVVLGEGEGNATMIEQIKVTEAGSETINGVDTTKYTFTAALGFDKDWQVWISKADGNLVRLDTGSEYSKSSIDFGKMNAPLTIEAPIK